MHLSLKSLFEIIAVIIFAAVVVNTGIAIVVSSVVVNLVIVFVVFILAVIVLVLVILDTSHLKRKNNDLFLLSTKVFV